MMQLIILFIYFYSIPNYYIISGYNSVCYSFHVLQVTVDLMCVLYWFVMQTVDQSFAIELIIGWTQNTRTVARYLFSNEIINVTDSLNVLNCLEFRSFWISWHNGMLRVGSGYTYSRDVLIEAKVLSFIL